jgi:predicted aspartyl protease
MITGTVNANYEMVIRLQVLGPTGQSQTVEAVLDSGFTGALTLSPSLIPGLGLAWHMKGSAVLANGVIERFELYRGTVVWDGTPLPILVQAIDAPPLLGVKLLIGYELRAQFEVGGSVEIVALPP